mgnify:CR=1 FL=1
MGTIKNILIISVLLTALVLSAASCGKDEPDCDVEFVDDGVTTFSKTITVPDTGGEYTFRIKSGIKWTAMEYVPDVHGWTADRGLFVSSVSPATGKGEAVVRVGIPKNRGASRTISFRFMGEGGKGCAEARFNQGQNPYIVCPTNLYAGGAQSVYTFDVELYGDLGINTSLQLTPTVDWISRIKATWKKYGVYTVSFQCSENPGGHSRAGDIEVGYDFEGVARSTSIFVMQYAQ